jgi:hypothetical protein
LAKPDAHHGARSEWRSTEPLYGQAGRRLERKPSPRGTASGHGSTPRLGSPGYRQVQNECKPVRGDYGTSSQSLFSKSVMPQN